MDGESGQVEVLVVGGGPTGLVLAAELALAGVDVLVVERRTSQALDGSRAGGLHPRSIEVLDQRGVADRFLAAGTVMQTAGFAGIRLDVSDFPSRHPYGLALWQSRIEQLLADWALDELGVPIRRGAEVVGVTQDDTGVDVALADGSHLRAGYVVGCDGGRSVVRKAVGIDLVGADASRSWVLAELELAEVPPVGTRPEGGGVGPVDPATEGGPYRVVLTEREIEHPGDATLDDVRDALVATYGTDFGAHAPTWVTRFTDAARQAVEYRRGRVLLAGDAAHVHPPQGGQGLNTGLQDAVNLGWKLGQVVRGTSPEDLLDTYHRERHPVAARAVHNTMAQVALATPGERHQALRDVVADLLGTDEARRAVAGMMTALDVAYDLGVGHPLVGRRVPDLDLVTVEGPVRVAELLHAARPLLLDLGGGSFDLGPWAGRVQRVGARYDGRWELPVLGEVAAPAAVLVRPDGHAAWAGDLHDPALPDALRTWCGAAQSSSK